MEVDQILEEKMPKAIEYAAHIIAETKSFMEFAIELTDYMGEDFIPYSKMVYAIFRSLPHTDQKAFDQPEELSKINFEDISNQYHVFVENQKKRQRKQEFKENIDELQFLVRSYRNSDEFKKLLDFVGRFNYIAPYNAMLVQMQKPGATFVLNGKKWASFGRKPKLNAQKIIILKPFGPIQCIFDYGDTEPLENAKDVIDETGLMEIFDKSLKRTEGDVPPNTMSVLKENLNNYGIYLDDSFLAANTYGGYIMKYGEKDLWIEIGNEHPFKTKSRFVITTNKNQTAAEQFHTICHELGHLFCYHQSYNPSLKRTLTKKEREFEAETVAWLVCKRHGIKNPSEEYLASYAPEGEIPICSTELIMKAVTEIEKMLAGVVKVKDTMLYKEDKKFKEEVKSELEKVKNKDYSLGLLF